jgi:hypothetical protein
MIMQRTLFHVALSLALLTGSLAPYSADAATPGAVRTIDQGIHKLNALDGQLVIITGTYQDTTAYKRSLSVFFQKNGDPVWHHVPIAEDKDTLTTEWFHVSRGESTLSDAAVVQRGKDIFLIVVERNPDKRVFKTTRYRFQKSGDDYPDAPSLLFVPQSSNTVSGTKSDTVETMLQKETGTTVHN